VSTADWWCVAAASVAGLAAVAHLAAANAANSGTVIRVADALTAVAVGLLAIALAASRVT
jgi:hypothetical protein